MQTILVATDYSRAANNALAYAATLAHDMQAKLVLYNAFQLPPPIAVSLLPEERKNRFIAENKARLASLALHTARRYNLTVNWSTTVSDLDETLEEQVERASADLVILGVPRKVEGSLFFGSTITSLIRHAKFPLLAVPEDYVFTGLNRMLFACDYHLLASDNQLTLLQHIACTFNARLQVLHVEKEKEELAVGAYHGHEEYGAQMDSAPASIHLESLFTNIEHSYKYIGDNNVVHGIDRGISEYKADLLVMVPHKASFWESLMERSNTCKMALQTHVPLLALPNTAN